MFMQWKSKTFKILYIYFYYKWEEIKFYFNLVIKMAFSSPIIPLEKTAKKIILQIQKEIF